MININRLLYSKAQRHMNQVPRIVVKGGGKMTQAYASQLKKDWKQLNCSDKYLVHKIEVYPKLRSEDHVRLYGRAFPINSTIQVSMTNGKNKILGKDERERTLMHEIGHLKYYHLPDKEKDRIADEEEYSYAHEDEKVSTFPSFYELSGSKDRKAYDYNVVDKTSGQVVLGPTSVFRARQAYLDLTSTDNSVFGRYAVRRVQK